MQEHNRKKCFESIYEVLARKEKLSGRKPLVLADFAKDSKDNGFLKEFMY